MTPECREALQSGPVDVAPVEHGICGRQPIEPGEESDGLTEAVDDPQIIDVASQGVAEFVIFDDQHYPWPLRAGHNHN